MGRFSNIKTSAPLNTTPGQQGAGSNNSPVEDNKGENSTVVEKTDKAKKKSEAATAEMLRTKLRIHSQSLDTDDIRSEIESKVIEMVREEKMRMNHDEVKTFTASIIDEMIGLGPLEPLLADDSISDIFINTHEKSFIERKGELEQTDVKFADEDHLLRIVNKIVAAVVRRIDAGQSMVDARLLYGSRVTVAIAPVVVDGPLVSIRKFSKKLFTIDKLVEFGAVPDVVAQFLWAACKAKVSTLISGGTGSGKTTLLNALSQSISHKERLITMEDAAELQLQQPHVARMETRPPNLEGKGEIRQRELVKNALRMRSDRVILGEVRGEEAFDMLQAMNTGHECSLATLHANTPRDAITRLEQMVAMGDMKISPEAIAGQIASAVGIIIQAQRLSEEQRKITGVTEVTGMEGRVIQMQEIFNYTRTGIGPNNEVIGEFKSTGIRPRCLQEVITRDIYVDETIFEPKTLPVGKLTDILWLCENGIL